MHVTTCNGGPATLKAKDSNLEKKRSPVSQAESTGRARGEDPRERAFHHHHAEKIRGG
jgi:hypothetical protein